MADEISKLAVWVPVIGTLCVRLGVNSTFDCYWCGWGLDHDKNLKKLEKLITYCIVGIFNFLLKYWMQVSGNK